MRYPDEICLNFVVMLTLVRIVLFGFTRFNQLNRRQAISFVFFFADGVTLPLVLSKSLSKKIEFVRQFQFVSPCESNLSFNGIVIACGMKAPLFCLRFATIVRYDTSPIICFVAVV